MRLIIAFLTKFKCVIYTKANTSEYIENGIILPNLTPFAFVEFKKYSKEIIYRELISPPFWVTIFNIFVTLSILNRNTFKYKIWEKVEKNFH